VLYFRIGASAVGAATSLPRDDDGAGEGCGEAGLVGGDVVDGVG